MFQNDYLMRMIAQLVAAIQRAMRDTRKEPERSIEAIEAAVGNAVDIDPRLFFSLAPDSMVSMLQLGSFDENLCEYVVRSFYCEAELFEEVGDVNRANLRRAQADAIAEAYGKAICVDDVAPEALEEFFERKQEEQS